MCTLKEAMDAYHNLSCEDRMTFYITLTNDVDLSQETVHGFLLETRFSDEKKCIRCGSTHFVKNGTRKDGTQRYLCRDCKKSFLLSTNSISSGTHKRLSVWKKYFDCMLDKKTLKETSEACSISMGTAFLWRHKILDALQEMAGKVRLSGTVEADETFFSVSYKGNHRSASGFAMPREAHKRGGEVHTKGLSSEKVCVVCAIDEENIPIAKAAKTGKISSECVEKVLSDRLGPDTILCTDQEKAYHLYTQTHQIEWIPMDTDRRTNGIYGIQRINAYHSRLKGFLSRFRGVSSKYLDNYLAWYNLMFCCTKEKEEAKRMTMGYSFLAHSETRCADIPRRAPVPSVI